ncbi:hypothetical protein PR048_021855 [Dryococelus australis]|uniref:Uncharacterized protein n=1 Tax=Dryococelus australis TaxID=614101 RepID=A0ABQ9GZM3_9NEOP|nr:hypothetical protein PR048_021855 [Dryococelus australis]
MLSNIAYLKLAYKVSVLGKRKDGSTARLARRSDEALGLRVSVARIAPSLLDLERAEFWAALNIEYLRAYEGETSEMSMEQAPERRSGGNQEIPEKTRRPATSSTRISHLWETERGQQIRAVGSGNNALLDTPLGQYQISTRGHCQRITFRETQSAGEPSLAKKGGGGGERELPEKSRRTSGIVRHDSYVRKIRERTGRGLNPAHLGGRRSRKNRSATAAQWPLNYRPPARMHRVEFAQLKVYGAFFLGPSLQRCEDIVHHGPDYPERLVLEKVCSSERAKPGHGQIKRSTPMQHPHTSTMQLAVGEKYDSTDYIIKTEILHALHVGAMKRLGMHVSVAQVMLNTSRANTANPCEFCSERPRNFHISFARAVLELSLQSVNPLLWQTGCCWVPTLIRATECHSITNGRRGIGGAARLRKRGRQSVGHLYPSPHRGHRRRRVLPPLTDFELQWRETTTREEKIHHEGDPEAFSDRHPNSWTGETGDPRENPQTSCIVRRDSYMRVSVSYPAGNRIRGDRCSHRDRYHVKYVKRLHFLTRHKGGNTRHWKTPDARPRVPSRAGFNLAPCWTQSVSVCAAQCLSVYHQNWTGRAQPYEGIVPHDGAGRPFFAGISRFPSPCITALLHAYLASPVSALKTSILRCRPYRSLASRPWSREEEVRGGGGGSIRLLRAARSSPLHWDLRHGPSSLSGGKNNRSVSHESGRRLTSLGRYSLSVGEVKTYALVFPSGRHNNVQVRGGDKPPPPDCLQKTKRNYSELQFRLLRTPGLRLEPVTQC